MEELPVAMKMIGAFAEGLVVFEKRWEFLRIAPALEQSKDFA